MANASTITGEPWVIDTAGGTRSAVVCRPGKDRFTGPIAYLDANGDERQHANLIASAPYMRWALKQMLAMMDGSSARPTVESMAALEFVVRKALKMAEGGAT